MEHALFDGEAGQNLPQGAADAIPIQADGASQEPARFLQAAQVGFKAQELLPLVGAQGGVGALGELEGGLGQGGGGQLHPLHPLGAEAKGLNGLGHGQIIGRIGLHVKGSTATPWGNDS